MADDYSPFAEGGPFWAGRNTDGSFSVRIRMRVEVQDEIGMRAQNLLDPDIPGSGMSTPDWGTEAAIVSAVGDALRDVPWKDRGITAVEISADVPPSTMTMPPGSL